jgi:pimeloyl-ACP methyl ester carboxylesterase
MAADVNRLLEHLGIERAIIGGLSMGGGVSLAFALNYPQKVRALILCDSAGVGVRSPQMQVTREQMDRQMEERERIVREYGVVEQGYRSIVAGLAPKAVLEDPVLQEEYIERMSHFSANGSIYASRFVMRNAVQGVERTKELTMPTLIVIGEEDVGLLPAAEWLRNTLPNRRYAFLKGVGHATSRYKPEAWRKAVLDFLDDFEQGKDIRGEVTL